MITDFMQATVESHHECLFNFVGKGYQMVSWQFFHTFQMILKHFSIVNEKATICSEIISKKTQHEDLSFANIGANCCIFNAATAEKNLRKIILQVPMLRREFSIGNSNFHLTKLLHTILFDHEMIAFCSCQFPVSQKAKV